MTITLNLSAQEIAELKQLTNQSDEVAAVRAAMMEYLRYVKRLQLKELSGHVEMQENWQEMENSELKAAHDSL